MLFLMMKLRPIVVNRFGVPFLRPAPGGLGLPFARLGGTPGPILSVPAPQERFDTGVFSPAGPTVFSGSFFNASLAPRLLISQRLEYEAWKSLKSMYNKFFAR